MAKIERDGIEMAERNMTACLAQGDGEGARFWREVAKAGAEVGDVTWGQSSEDPHRDRSGFVTNDERAAEFLANLLDQYDPDPMSDWL
jgi:hypothetical protein